MSDNVDGLRGEFRRFTAIEIGGVIRLLRDQQAIKRAALAADANVSEKTVERAEAGEGISEESCRRIACALGLKEDAFTRELFIPTPEEAERAQQRELEERRKTHHSVTVRTFTGARDVLSLFGHCGLIAEDRCVAEKHLTDFAELKQSLIDWSDMADDIPAPDRVEAAQAVLQQARAFEALGYVVKAGVAEHRLKSEDAHSSAWTWTVLVAFKKPRGSVDTSPEEVWLPRKQRLQF